MTVSFKNIVIPVETTARELTPKLYLASALARAGFNVFLGQKDLTLQTALILGNCIYIDKGYHRGVSEKIYAQLRKAGCLIASLDEENGVDFRDFHMLNNRMPDSFLEQMDLVMLWGTKQQDHLQTNRTKFNPDIVRVTGHPRFDLLKAKNRGLYQDKVAAITERFGDFILFNTNSKYSNNINGRDAVVANYGGRVRGLEERLAYDDQRLALNISLIHRLAGELGKTVIIRPHPEESIEVYRKTFAQYPNVHALYEDSALYWILAAEGVIHNHSTTGLEAATLGKNPIAYTPIATEENFCPWIPIACSHRFEREDDAVSFIAKGRWNEKPAQMEEILEGYFSYNEDALPKVVGALCGLRDENSFGGKTGGIAFQALKWRLRAMVARLAGRETQSALIANKLKDLTPSVVRSKFEELESSIFANDKAVKLKKHTNTLYEISAVQ